MTQSSLLINIYQSSFCRNPPEGIPNFGYSILITIYGIDSAAKKEHKINRLNIPESSEIKSGSK
jgi:hypothetical protein